MGWPSIEAQDGIEEQHRLAAQGAIGTARLEEHHGGTGEPAKLDLAGDELDELLPRRVLVDRQGAR